MKFSLGLLAVGFLFFGCAPSVNTSSVVPAAHVDEASYHALIDVKWCQQNVQRAQDFVISWVFTNDNFAQWTKTKIENQQVISNKKVKWELLDKTIVVRELTSDLIILQKTMSVNYDLTLAKKIMTWVTPSSSSQCSNGSCQSQTSESMVLNECE